MQTAVKLKPVAARLDAELKQTSKMLGREQRSEVSYVPYFMRTQTSRFVRYSSGVHLDYPSGDRTSQPQTPQRRRTTDFWAKF